MATLLEEELGKEMKQRQNNHTDEEIEISLMDIFRKIIAIRKAIYKAAGIGLVIGIIIAISIPKKYTVEVTLSPEMGNVKGGGLSGLAASFLGSGATMSEGTDALNASLSADIVSSTPFLLELSTMKIPVSKDENMTLNTYLDEESSPWWNYIIGFPSMVIGGIKSLFTEKDDESMAFSGVHQGTIELSKKELKRIGMLKKKITATVDKNTYMTSVTVTLQNPRVAAVVADSVVKKLQEYIIGYRTSKAKEDCIYLEKLFKERQQEYYTAQKKYADYLDSHDNIILQSVRAEQELAARRSGAVSQVEIRRVLRHDKLAEKAREHDERQNHSGDDRLAAQGMSVFRGCGLRQRSRADDLEAVVHGCTSASRTACSARMRGSICSLIVWAMMLHRMTSAPESRLSSISRL